jgi:hypothetical protein
VIGIGDQALITRVLDSFARENDMLMTQLLDIQYYFRGALTRDDIWMMCPVEREAAVTFLNKRFKEIGDIAKKTGQAPAY